MFNSGSPMRRNRQDVPGLARINSMSSSSGPSLPGTPQRLRSRSGRQTSSRSSDSHILRGAEILRKEIMGRSFNDDTSQPTGSYYSQSPSRQTHAKDPPEDPPSNIKPGNDDNNLFFRSRPQSDDDSESTDWSDPWPPPKPEVSQDVNNDRPTTPWDELPAEHQTQFSYQNAQTWANLSDGENGDDDDDTEEILARAGEILERAAAATGTPVNLIYYNPPDAAPPEDTSSGLSQSLLGDKIAQPSSNLESTSGVNRGTYLPSALRQQANRMVEMSGPTTSRVLGCFTPQQSEPAETPVHCNPLDLLRDLQAGERGIFLQQPEEDHRRKEQMEKERNQMIQKAVKVDHNVALMAFPTVTGPSPCDSIVPPSSETYKQLLRDPGFCHAQNAGILWQSLVSQHVRFPSKWWNGSRSPPMGVASQPLWNHVGRHRVRGNDLLNQKVRNRGAAGRLLLHLIVGDIMTGETILDVAVGCFHPNARGIRKMATFDPNLEDCRDIWLATRQRSEEVSVVETILRNGQEADDSPLGSKHDVQNSNLRAVFGETPPLYTLFVSESEIYELFSKREGEPLPPTAILLEEYIP